MTLPSGEKHRQKIRELEQEITKCELNKQELERNYENSAVLNQLLKLSLDEITVDKLCRIAVEKLYDLSWFTEKSAATIFFAEGDPPFLVHRTSIGLESCLIGPCEKVLFGQCLCGLAAETGEVQFSSHVDARHTLCHPQMKPHGHYCVPVKLAGQTLGVISLYLPDGHPHDQREEDFFVAVANTLAGIIQRHRIIDEKNRYEVMLCQAQKVEAIGTLSGGIAHDFNNMLAPILGYAELALRDLDGESRAASRIKEIVQAATRAKELVRQILILSQKVEHRSDALTSLNPKPVIREVLSLVRATIPSSIEIIQQYDAACCNVLVDPTHIHQIILNLCTNAYHAMSEASGSITISLSKKQLTEDDRRIAPFFPAAGDYLLLKVSDTGIGMDKNTVERIFDPYFTTKKPGEGTGLGLSVVSGIVKSYGGHISVQSQPGQGTTFKLFIPCCDEPGTTIVGRNEAELPTGCEHIMVVDDEPQVGEMYCASLEQLGYRVSLFSGCVEAIEAFGREPEAYDLVLTDMTMPKLTGLDLQKKIRGIRADIPMILCTGFSEKINEKKAQEYGFRKYLMKPVTLRKLSHVVRDALDGK